MKKHQVKDPKWKPKNPFLAQTFLKGANPHSLSLYHKLKMTPQKFGTMTEMSTKTKICIHILGVPTSSSFAESRVLGLMFFNEVDHENKTPSDTKGNFS